jgi:hypothetical protein
MSLNWVKEFGELPRRGRLRTPFWTEEIVKWGERNWKLLRGITVVMVAVVAAGILTAVQLWIQRLGKRMIPKALVLD